ncbi:MAG: hypothetical protein H7Z18_07170 [Methylophilaceae bacterium]|nr:hypothetical protein [Methylophilaceae bacterium]
MKLKKLAQSLVLLMAACGTHAIAGPADYVYTPQVEYGEREIDFKTGTGKVSGEDREHVTSLGFGYGATEYWFTELYLKRETAGDDGISIVEFENKFQLTETGKYPIDIGLITEIEAPLQNGNPYEFKFGPLFQTDFGKVQLNANVLFERTFGGGKDQEHITEAGYQWQVKYRWKPQLEFGAQGIGEVGKWDHWDDSDNQKHRIGPAIFGKIALDNHHAIRYNAAWLIGVSDGAENSTLRAQVEYEF